eukprot:COSAG06_NODE_918_length_11551_cov_4.681802_3_plen_125_part_00
MAWLPSEVPASFLATAAQGRHWLVGPPLQVLWCFTGNDLSAALNDLFATSTRYLIDEGRQPSFRQAGKVGMQPQWQVAVLIGSDYYRTYIALLLQVIIVNGCISEIQAAHPPARPLPACRATQL